jgi:hypothetical protein
VTAGRTARSPGMAVMTGRCGPSGGDGRADDTVPGHGGDSNGAGGSQGGDSVVPGVVVKVEEERDGDGGEGGGGV